MKISKENKEELFWLIIVSIIGFIAVLIFN